jgi:hypothetical protein
MAIPWLRVFDAVVGVADLALGFRTKPRTDDLDQLSLYADGRTLGGLEVRLAGVVVAALKEAFDRDARRLDFEREQLEAERRRAERALRVESLRQAGDRELARLRFAAGVATVCWIVTLFLSLQFRGGGALGARVALGLGWAFLLGAMAAAFIGQSGVGRTLAGLDPDRDSPIQPTVAGLMAPWFIVIGLALVGLAVFIG